MTVADTQKHCQVLENAILNWQAIVGDSQVDLPGFERFSDIFEHRNRRGLEVCGNSRKFVASVTRTFSNAGRFLDELQKASKILETFQITS